jgi:hypothetical protein
MNSTDMKNVIEVLSVPSVRALMQSNEFMANASVGNGPTDSSSPQITRTMTDVLANGELVQKIALLYTKLHGYSS